MRVLRTGVALLALLMLAGCSDNEQAIFFFIENEEKQVDYSLPNETTILGMARVTIALDDHYFASSGGALWRRKITENDWTQLPRPAGAGWCTALVAFPFDGKLYAGGLAGLYTAAPAVSPVWTSVAAAGSDQIVALFAPGGGSMFAVTFDGSAYGLLSSADGSTWGTAGLAGLSRPITQVTWDGAVTYYAVVGQAIYSGPAGAVTNAQTPPSLASGDWFEGIHWANARLYLATNQGMAFSGSPVSWTDTKDLGGSGVGLHRIRSVGSNVLFGTYEDGFYFTGASLDVTALTRIPDFTATELYNGQVIDFYDDGSTVFALTAGSGLWRADWTTEWSSWIHE